MRQNPSPLGKATGLTIDNADESVTEAVAKKLANAMLLALDQARVTQSSQTSLRVHLRGDLGAGKTTFVRAFLRACGIHGRIKSPSFSILESYEAQGLQFHHLDFYRQDQPEAWQHGGIREIMSEPGITLIEWPEHARGMPDPHLLVAIDWLNRDEPEGPRQLTLSVHDQHDGIDLSGVLDAIHDETNGI
jgi:tRNA threonylcarbamoyladenosine biosynthesis protein TsaE